MLLSDTEKPATGAAVVVRGGTLGTVVDKDGTFSLNVEGNPELVISYVGYSSLIINSSEVGNKPLKLEVKTYTMDLESVPLEVKKESSGTISIKTKDGSGAQPEFVVDGEVVKEIDNLDPDQIDNISVHKDSESDVVKKYNAKDGVIIITTKEGAKLLTPEDEGEVFYVVEEMPMFPGDLPALKTYIYSNLEYPEKAKDQGIEGEVIVRFLINEKGQAVNEEVLRSTYEGFNAPALKVIDEMPNWKPGKQRGKAVKVWYVMSIKFDGSKK